MAVAVTQVQRSSGSREKDPLETIGQVAALAKTGYDMSKGDSTAMDRRMDKLGSGDSEMQKAVTATDTNMDDSALNKSGLYSGKSKNRFGTVG
jgi:hypothetical protein